jgi:hypothetical protein
VHEPVAISFRALDCYLGPSILKIRPHNTAGGEELSPLLACGLDGLIVGYVFDRVVVVKNDIKA